MYEDESKDKMWGESVGFVQFLTLSGAKKGQNMIWVHPWLGVGFGEQKQDHSTFKYNLGACWIAFVEQKKNHSTFKYNLGACWIAFGEQNQGHSALLFVCLLVGMD